MPGINDLFNIGRSGIFAFQRAIHVTSHNITNQATKGYSRQEANFVAARPQGGLVPTGVEVSSVQRSVDAFIESQLTTVTGELGRHQARFDRLQQLEVVFTENESIGISHELNDLFNAFRDLSTFPENAGIRNVVLNEAQSLATALNQAANSLTDSRTAIDLVINQDLTTVNGLASQIASLNNEIHLAEVGGESANDLRDKRQVLVNDLAKLINIEVLSLPDGLTINVGGQLLVGGDHAHSLVQVIDPDNSALNHVAVERDDGSRFTITSRITGGELKGLLGVRDTELVEAQDRLDRLAAVVINEVNQQHEAGFGLDGTTGNALFAALGPLAPVARETNTGGAAGTSTSVLTAASLTMDNYEIRFTSATQFDVVNVTDGTTVLSAQAYTSGANIDFDGLRVVITNATGAPASGDVFSASAHKGAAGAIAVSLTAINKIAASSTAAGVPGNNINARSLVAIQTASQGTLGNVTLNEYHAATIADVGSDVAAAETQLDITQTEINQIQLLRESVSGVNLDEELAALLSFQRAYEASARLITTADEMFQTVLAMGR